MPQGFAVQEATSVDVIAAWVTSNEVVQGVASTPGWTVLGEYYLPTSCNARLDVTHLVSASGLTSTVRLWDSSAGAAVSGAIVSTEAQSVTRTLGPTVSLTGGKSYQVQAECTGATGNDKFSNILSATIS